MRNWKSSPLVALTALVGITAVWGGTFILVQNAVARMPVMDFLAWRFAAAAVVLIAIRPGCFRKMTYGGIWRGVLLGLVLGAGYIAQTFGLRYTYAAISGFITGMFVVLTPVMSWLLLKHHISRIVWLAVGLATLGLGLLSLHGWSVGFGELLTLGCAVFFAVHIVGLGEWSGKYELYGLTVIQIGTVAVLSVIAAGFGGISAPPDKGVWGAVILTAVLATALAFLVQTWTQSLVSATRAAVIMTMEPVFAGVFGFLIAGNPFTLRTLAGILSVLAAMLLVSLRQPKKEIPLVNSLKE